MEFPEGKFIFYHKSVVDYGTREIRYEYEVDSSWTEMMDGFFFYLKSCGFVIDSDTIDTINDLIYQKEKLQ